MTPLECVRRVIECDNNRDAAGYRAILHDDYVSQVQGTTQNENADDEVASLVAWWESAPDVHLEELDTFVDHNTVTLRYRLTGTNQGALGALPATGKPFVTEACTLLEVIDGKVKRTWRFADTFGLLTQLGVIPTSGNDREE